MLTRLALTDFRNHADALLTPGARFTVLTGENGAGKTNVLEAVSLLAPGRGLRRGTMGEIARQGGPGGFAVAARLDDVAIGTGTQPGAPERRLVRINGAAAPATRLAEWLTVLWLTPAMDRLFVEPAGERRRFLDRLTLALAPDHAGHAQRYEAAMRERNRLLAEDGLADPEWLTALEVRMAEHGAALDARRRDTVAALGERLAAIPDDLFARAGLALEGETPVDAGRLIQTLREGRRRDAAAGRALAGPHRTDLSVTHLAKGQAAALCSTGEQKALLLGLVLAHAALAAERSGRPPVLLLDEVAAHLDEGRRRALFERLAGVGQVWLTGTERALFAGLPADAVWVEVAEGSLSQA